MSDEKTTSPQTTQQPQQQQSAPPVDALDAEYKPIGISAVSAAAAIKSHKPKTPGSQMS
jgi:hypothetical protein